MLINRVKDYRKGAGLTQEDLALLQVLVDKQ
ncbi:MAG: hypothetical protein CM15mP109_06110 [Candidatus Dadabacteria bacterium]|nr:MAG: hypothetical protein CM15mP109_06110 [Candidatus Dadabacteria bacterium]